MKTSLLRHAIRQALAMGVIAMPVAAVAQDQATPPPPETTELDRIEVTGSRIRQVDVETAQPVLTISREEIERQGFKSVADILQNITAAGSPAISRSAPLSAGEAVGGIYIDLRNLGPNRTLILLNGKRLGITTDGLQDVASIPAAAVERMEVLKDGASAIYGSDAMAGVINIITRKNYEGAQANAYLGNYSQGDGFRQSYDAVLGFTGEKGSLTVAAEYSDEEAVFARDRAFSATGFGARHPLIGYTTVSQWGGITGLPGGNYVLDRGGNPYDFGDFHLLDPSVPDGDVSNPNEQMHLYNPIERKSVYVDGTYDISENFRFRTNILYSNRIADRQIAGYPYQSGAFGTPMSADSYYNPLGNRNNPGAGQDINFFRRTWEMPRSSESDLKTYRFTGWLEGSFDLGERYFDWDAGFLSNKNDLLQTSTGNLSIPNAAAAVGPSYFNSATGRVECGTADNPITYGSALGSCVPWNPLIPFGREGDGGLTNNADLLTYLFPEEHATGVTKTTAYYANLTGSLFTLPAGDLGFAVGVEHRQEEGEFTPDALSQSGSSTNLAAGPTSGGYSVDELYAELNLPILADAPFAKELSLSFASRYSDYDTFGETINSKFGFKWKPIDSLLVRGTWSEGFRAPTVADLFGGGSQTFAFFTDPCDTLFGNAADNASTAARCAEDIANAANYRQLEQGFVPADAPNQQTPIPFFSGSNPNLLPETSESKTLGVVWSPEFIEGLNMSLDWWNIYIESTIVADSPTQMLNDCYILGVESRCQNFTRDPVTGIVNDLTFGGRNAGFVETEGFDFDVSYKLQTDFGNLGADWRNTYVSKNNIKTTDDEDTPISPLVSFGGNFRLRSNLNLTWDKGPFGATWGMRYYSAMKEVCSFEDECNIPDYEAPDTGGNLPLNRLGSNTFHDVQFRWIAPWDATVAIGANNVFEHEGPSLYSQPNANFSYYGGFDIGRFVYLQYQQRF